MATRKQKIEELAGFLELNAHAQVSDHSSHDGLGCQGHSEAFEGLAAELLELIEDNYGYGASHSDEPEAASE